MTEDELKQRRARYRELFERIPARKTSERIDWLVENLHCSRSTARIWNMGESKRPIPKAKLAIMETMLAKSGIIAAPGNAHGSGCNAAEPS